MATVYSYVTKDFCRWCDVPITPNDYVDLDGLCLGCWEHRQLSEEVQNQIKEWLENFDAITVMRRCVNELNYTREKAFDVVTKVMVEAE